MRKHSDPFTVVVVGCVFLLATAFRSIYEDALKAWVLKKLTDTFGAGAAGLMSGFIASIAGNSLNDFTAYIVGAVSDEKLLPDLNFVRGALIEAGIDCRFEDISPSTVGGPFTTDRVWLIVGRKQ